MPTISIFFGIVVQMYWCGHRRTVVIASAAKQSSGARCSLSITWIASSLRRSQ